MGKPIIKPSKATKGPNDEDEENVESHQRQRTASNAAAGGSRRKKIPALGKQQRVSLLKNTKNTIDEDASGVSTKKQQKIENGKRANNKSKNDSCPSHRSKSSRRFVDCLQDTDNGESSSEDDEVIIVEKKKAFDEKQKISIRKVAVPAIGAALAAAVTYDDFWRGLAQIIPQHCTKDISVQPCVITPIKNH